MMKVPYVSNDKTLLVEEAEMVQELLITWSPTRRYQGRTCKSV